MKPQNPAGLAGWSNAVRAAVLQSACRRFLEGPVAIQIHYYLGRPGDKAHRDLVYRDKSPDLDKLDRAVYDALKGIAWADDRQVVAAQSVAFYETDEHPLGADVWYWQVANVRVPLFEDLPR